MVFVYQSWLCSLQPAKARTCSSASEIASVVQRAKQYQAFREELLTWEKTASECDRCSMMGEAVRFGMPFFGNEYTQSLTPIKNLPTVYRFNGAVN
ncbi:hypothetical protein QUB10_28475 [Microcoleus sp. B5-D4]|uniref:hypothetical protein n=1 Tax=unclassified Microcoleus TaxID=2642155 RepID=UPI002FD7554C